MHTAQIAGKRVNFLFQNDPGQNPPDRDTSNCRLAVGISVED